MTSSKNVVMLAADGSPHSMFAFDWYVSHLHRSENHLLLAHCPETFANVTVMSENNLVQPCGGCLTFSTMSSGKVQELLSECEMRIKTIQDRYLDKMKHHGIQGEFVCLDGDKPGHAIVDCAHEKNVAYIVTGTRGLGKIRRTIMGSVSDYIVHHSPVPVLVCRHKDVKDGDEKEKEKE